MKITDNFLDKSEFENINKTFHLSNFPWYFMPFKVHEGDDNYQFYHLFIAKGKVLSKHFDILHPILKKLSVKEIIRIPKRPGEPFCTWANIKKITTLTKWKPKIKFEDGVNKILKDIDYWKNSPLWDKRSIEQATNSWFKYLN